MSGFGCQAVPKKGKQCLMLYRFSQCQILFSQLKCYINKY
ncbi:hypothetical protein D1AOALGA4SA_989 [Olavius algarvensis Delta 1 endosymbiont]|nr:hypothetical protein D1AOALGA4SA_989 [Olavius algarvensis Delta 1 endosymbiont]